MCFIEKYGENKIYTNEKLQTMNCGGTVGIGTGIWIEGGVGRSAWLPIEDSKMNLYLTHNFTCLTYIKYAKEM